MVAGPGSRHLDRGRLELLWRQLDGARRPLLVVIRMPVFVMLTVLLAMIFIVTGLLHRRAVSGGTLPCWHGSRWRQRVTAPGMSSWVLQEDRVPSRSRLQK